MCVHACLCVCTDRVEALTLGGSLGGVWDTLYCPAPQPAGHPASYPMTAVLIQHLETQRLGQLSTKNPALLPRLALLMSPALLLRPALLLSPALLLRPALLLTPAPLLRPSLLLVPALPRAHYPSTEPSPSTGCTSTTAASSSADAYHVIVRKTFSWSTCCIVWMS